MDRTALDSAVNVELTHLEARLVDEWVDYVPAEVVRELLVRSVEELESGTVRRYLPVLVERAVRERVARMLHPAA